MANTADLPSSAAGLTGVQQGQQSLSPPPAVQPGAAPGRPAGDQGDRNIFENAALCRWVAEDVKAGPMVWAKTLLGLRAQQRNDFLIVSFWKIVAMNKGSHAEWSGTISMITHAVGIQAMLAQKWPLDLSVAHLFACLKDHTWLDLALASQSGPQSLHSTGDRGWSPLYIAAGNGKKKIVQAILAFDDEAGSLRLKKNTKDNSIPLHFACRNNNGSIVKLLLSSKGNEQRLSANYSGRLPIHYAVITSVGAMPHLLAECAVEQVAAKTHSDGDTALIIAARFTSPVAVKLLLGVPGTLDMQLGASDNQGRRAIDHARIEGNAEVIALLEAAMQTLAAGASPAVTATSTSTSTSTTATRLQPAIGNEPPAPQAPCPASSGTAEQPDFSETEEDDNLS
jgi:ankyrin repeat protein